jgi:hypothetical protein
MAVLELKRGGLERRGYQALAEETSDALCSRARRGWPDAICESRLRRRRLPEPKEAFMRITLGLAAILAAAPLAAAEPPLTIERLFSEGWEIAGYTSGYDNRSTLILFRHKDKNYLIQCSTLYDVTREPRVNVNCYELH